MNQSTVRAERLHSRTEMTVGICAFPLLTQSGIRGKVCHARIQMLSIARPRFPAVSLFNTSFYFWSISVCYQKYLCLTVKSSRATLRFGAIAEAKTSVEGRKEGREISAFFFLSISISIIQGLFEFLSGGDCWGWCCSPLMPVRKRNRF